MLYQINNKEHFLACFIINFTTLEKQKQRNSNRY